MRRALATLVFLLIGPAAAACGGHTSPGPRAAPLEVRVTNQNRSDVNLYLLRGGARSRLGTVVSNETRVFRVRSIPSGEYLDLQFEVQRIGAEGIYRTPRVAVAPGQGVSLRVEDLLVTSSVSVVEGPPLPARKPLP